VFSKVLSEVKDNLYDLLAIDLMHEFELGVWKAVLVHLLRIIDSLGRTAEATINSRYVEPDPSDSCANRFEDFVKCMDLGLIR
jgi:hypothetical protein